MRLALSAILLTLGLAACGPSPRETCIAEATAERDTVDRLIAETEENLLRGYALEAKESSARRFKLCAGGDSPLSVCAERTGPGETRPVAINPITERLKLANLRQRRIGLAELAEREIARCEAGNRR